MGNRLYVTNLPEFVDEEFLHTVFEQLGTARTIRLLREKESGKSKGTCFVEMASAREAREAIRSLDGVKFCQHSILEAHEAGPHLAFAARTESQRAAARKQREK